MRQVALAHRRIEFFKPGHAVANLQGNRLRWRSRNNRMQADVEALALRVMQTVPKQKTPVFSLTSHDCVDCLNACGPRALAPRLTVALAAAKRNPVHPAAGRCQQGRLWGPADGTASQPGLAALQRVILTSQTPAMSVRDLRRRLSATVTDYLSESAQRNCRRVVHFAGCCLLVSSSAQQQRPQAQAGAVQPAGPYILAGTFSTGGRHPPSSFCPPPPCVRAPSSGPAPPLAPPPPLPRPPPLAPRLRRRPSFVLK
uniref:HTH OST-type domain-containing protein n=1 Tax=Macrostomum lignano TaxID=282301 RepID=A0A1I8F761_9PLAT